MRILLKRSLLAAAVAMSVAACSDGGSSTPAPSTTTEPSEATGSTSTANTQTGLFLDSAVEGIHYKTETHEGTTNAKGEYTFEPGETVTFSIGELKLPPVKALGIVTPKDIGSENVATIIAQVLQTLDTDGDPSNGITLNDEVHAAAAGLSDLNFSSADFIQDLTPKLPNLIAASGSGKTELVSASDATAHMNETFTENLPNKFSKAWLANRTLYIVYYGDGFDAANDTELTNVAVMEKAIFDSTGSNATVSSVQNGENYQTTITINEDGYLQAEDDENDGTRIACGSTKDYIQTHFTVGGQFDTVDRWYFDEDTANSAVKALTKGFPISQCEKDAKKVATPHTLDDLNGRTIYGVWIDDEDNDGNPLQKETPVIVKETYNNNQAHMEILYGHDVGTSFDTGISIEDSRLTYASDKADEPGVIQGSKIICSNTQYFKSHWMSDQAGSGLVEDGIDYWFFDKFSAQSYVTALNEGDVQHDDSSCTES